MDPLLFLSWLSVTLVFNSAVSQASAPNQIHDGRERRDVDGRPFDDPMVLSRARMVRDLVTDSLTPMYGAVRTPCFPLRVSTSINSRLRSKILRSPELILSTLCLFGCLTWICASLALMFCFGHRYKCALCLSDKGLLYAIAHFMCCCFICHFCLDGRSKDPDCKTPEKIDPCSKSSVCSRLMDFS